MQRSQLTQARQLPKRKDIEAVYSCVVSAVRALFWVKTIQPLLCNALDLFYVHLMDSKNGC